MFWNNAATRSRFVAFNRRGSSSSQTLCRFLSDVFFDTCVHGSICLEGESKKGCPKSKSLCPQQTNFQVLSILNRFIRSQTELFGLECVWGSHASICHTMCWSGRVIHYYYRSVDLPERMKYPHTANGNGDTTTQLLWMFGREEKRITLSAIVMG